MRDTTVTIVMPTYNAQRYVAQAIRSVLDQDHSEWLLLVCDDGSRDRTHAIVRQFARRDERIRYLPAPRGHTGVCGARARGVRAAQSQWIAFLDSDDVWHPHKLSTQLRTARQEQAGFLFTASGFLNESSQRLDYVLRVPERIGYPDILKQNVISCSSVLIRRELAMDCFLPSDNGVCEDYAAWIRVLRDRVPYGVGIDRPLLYYRLSAGSVSFYKPKNALRVLKTYRVCGLSPWERGWFWGHYICNGLIKYARIGKSMRKRPYGLEFSKRV